MSYKSKITRELSEAAQQLVDIYNSVPGSSGPYANPDSLALVIKSLALALLESNPGSNAEELCATKLLFLYEGFFK